MANFTLDELDLVKDKLNLISFKRARFVISENTRTLNGAELLKKSNYHEFGKLMYDSHNGLKNLYEVSCVELDFIVDYTKKLNYVAGSRMMGGGFGGCTINLIGEHTDYNGGYVLPGTINKAINFEIFKVKKVYCEVKSAKINKSLIFEINNIKKSKTHWHNYILGTIDYFLIKKNKITPFKCSIKSNLPIGSGISSSSALISGFAKAIIELFELKYSKSDIVKIVSYVERNFIGLRGGIMDQFTINYGLKDNLILLNCDNSSYNYIQF